jgi:asparagine synthetase B (glutamine-hydrolysing)
MLLVALSRSSLLGQLKSHSARQFATGVDGWLLTILTDGFFSQVEVSEGEILASESLLGSLSSGTNVEFISARFTCRDQTLSLCKSSVSGRPLYYHSAGSGEFFASTHIRLLHEIGIAIEEDKDVLPELLIYRTAAPPRTIYRQIWQLPASGRILVQVNKQGCALLVNERYALTDALRAQADESDTSSRVAKILRESVGKLKPASQRVATLLSGGLDSSILCSLVKEQVGTYQTYSSSYAFEDPGKDLENHYALSAAAALSTTHTVFIPNSRDYVVGFVEALDSAETSLNHLQSVLLHLVFKSAIPRELDRVVHGAVAETAWGTDMHLLLHRSHSPRQRLLSTEPFCMGLRVAGGLWARAAAASKDVANIKSLGLPLSSPLNPLWAVSSYGDREWVKRYCKVSDEDIIRARYDNLQWFADRPLNDILSLYSLHFDVTTNIALWSKLAEGQGKIAYYPFATQELLDFAFSIPWEVRLRNPKHVLRETGRRLGIPEVILDRPKISFGINSRRWSEKGGVLEPLIPVAAKVVDIDELRSLQGTASQPAMTLWSLLNYAILKRLFILRERPESLVNEVLENYQRLHHKTN